MVLITDYPRNLCLRLANYVRFSALGSQAHTHIVSKKRSGVAMANDAVLLSARVSDGGGVPLGVPPFADSNFSTLGAEQVTRAPKNTKRNKRGSLYLRQWQAITRREGCSIGV